MIFTPQRIFLAKIVLFDIKIVTKTSEIQFSHHSNWCRKILNFVLIYEMC